MKEKVLGEIRFLTANFILGPLLGVIVCLLEAFRMIKIIHFERFPVWEEKLIIVANHPSLLEPVLLPAMGFPWMNFPWVFSPIWTRIRFSLNWFKELQREFSLSKKLIPASLPDKNNFYDPPYMKVLRGINVPVNRNSNASGRVATVLILRKMLEKGRRIIIFPEGTRTFKTDRETRFRTVHGKELGKLKDGAAWLALKTGARILPIWVEGTDKFLPNNKLPLPRFWHRITIKIGKPFSLDKRIFCPVTKENKEKATQVVVEHFLKLAEEKG